MLSATYSPDDNKLRLYASDRLDEDTYKRVKEAGFRWAPKQELFVAPMWTPAREDLLLELCGEIGDEDTSLVARAEERAERFEGYSERREAEAKQAKAGVDRIANGIPLGQPILVGHHSEKHARRDAQKIERGMRRAVKLWDTSRYWTSRAAGAIAAAKYRESPAVRQRRIRKLESEIRKSKATFTPDPRQKPHVWDGEEHVWCSPNGGGCGGRWVKKSDLPALEKHYSRWIAHYENRLAYERAMLNEQGGGSTDKWNFEVGGQVLVRAFGGVSEWLPVLRVNKGASGQPVSLSTPAPASMSWRKTYTVGVESVKDYRPPTEEHKKQAKAALKKPPLCNYRREGCIEMTKADWKRKHTDYKTTRTVEDAAYQPHRLRWAMAGGRYEFVFLTDAKRVDPPKAQATLIIEEPAPEPEREVVIHEPPEREPTERPEQQEFEQLRETVKAGAVEVVSSHQLFPTPPGIARRVVAAAEVEPGQRVLEPSAGTGNLITAVWNVWTGPDCGRLVAIESHPRVAEALRQKRQKHIGANSYNFEIHCKDFLFCHPVDPGFEVEENQAYVLGYFDRIVMNPPFDWEISHVEHAYKFLGVGGILVSIMSVGPFFRQNRRCVEFRQWLDEIGAEVEDLPGDAFKASGTSVRTKLVKIRKRR